MSLNGIRTVCTRILKKVFNLKFPVGYPDISDKGSRSERLKTFVNNAKDEDNGLHVNSVNTYDKKENNSKYNRLGSVIH